MVSLSQNTNPDKAPTPPKTHPLRQSPLEKYIICPSRIWTRSGSPITQYITSLRLCSDVQPIGVQDLALLAKTLRPGYAWRRKCVSLVYPLCNFQLLVHETSAAFLPAHVAQLALATHSAYVARVSVQRTPQIQVKVKASPEIWISPPDGH